MKASSDIDQPRGEAQFGLNARKVQRARQLDRLLDQVIGPIVKSREPPVCLRSLEPKTLLLLFPQLIGDAAILTGFLRGLRIRYPHASITIVGQRFLDELLGSQGLYDAFVEFRCPWRAFDYSLKNLGHTLRVLQKLRKQQWDLAIDVRGDVRNIAFLKATGARYRAAPDITGGAYLLTHALQVPANLRHLADSQRLVLDALGGSMLQPELMVKEVDQAWADERVSAIAGTRRVIAIHPGTSRESKHWFPERFAALAARIEENLGATSVLVLGPGDAALGESIATQCRVRLQAITPTLRQLPALLQRCDMLVGLDSASAHIAGAVGTPAIVLFGPSDPELARPLGNRSRIIIHDGFSCRPCGLGTCPLGVARSCMAAITVEDVVAALKEELGRLDEGTT